MSKVTSGINSTGHEIIVNVSNDYYQAFITIIVHDADTVIKMDELTEALKKKNITFGIDNNALDKIIQSPTLAENVLVAQGKPHVNGIDGEITYNFNMDMKAKPTMNADGSVDFKNMNFLQTCFKGDVLATRTMPTEGSLGMTVTEKNIRPKPGKIVNFKFGKNIEQTEDGLSIVATETGSIQLEGERVSIIKVLEIKDDVGIKTGNIEFRGKVIINGNVTTGHSVIADDEIIINGIVEGATVKTTGNLFINGGVQGHDQAELNVGGNLVSKFLNNANIYCKGNIEADAIMHSTINCDGSIVVTGRKALIVGGEINVRYNITARVIGSEMGTMTKLRMGVDSTVMNEYQKHLEEVKDMKETITKLSQASRMLRKQFDQTRNPEIKAMLDKTEISRTDYTRQMAEASQKLRDVTDLIETLKGSQVKSNEIFPGVKIRMGNSYYNVKARLDHVIIKRDEGDIRAVSY
ncbi:MULTISPECIES: DUF342 domain-containing protein [unclassified Fusibacter]|uniref:DUF342 domain-containing protein n=1 Tax=unclassified Fusibacter TaxID=2624464 RepID=UPI0010120E1E|nr:MULTISPECIES: FapA family protein [unclassified Fusibacter]MCK8058786.1 FapA family protein [Fusibacter sp. A2]NPE21860.1 DUF342 domain-containing protein [Fusibacter sp. A1]RXV61432.1 DUF342 domain-containing protein [Fusibacter sp. A1]